MKNKVAYILPFIAIVALFSCQKGESAQTAPSAGISSGAVVVPQANHGFATIIDAGFYVLRDGDNGDETTTVRWKDRLILGERFTTGEEARRLTFVSGNNQTAVYSFIEAVRSNGDSGFALVSQTAVGGTMAVVVDDAAQIFSSAQNIAATGNKLTRGSVLVSYPEAETGGFVRVKGRDFGRNVAITDQYVQSFTLSTRESNLESATLLLTANSLPEAQEPRKLALLDVAITNYPDSVFFTEIHALRYPQAAAAVQQVETTASDDNDYDENYDDWED